MINTEIQKKIEELFKNEMFCDKFFDNIDNAVEIKQLFTENEIDLSGEDIAQLIDLTKKSIAKQENGELAEDELDAVSGGIVGYIIAGVAGAIFFGYQTYKNRKKLNNTFGACDAP